MARGRVSLRRAALLVAAAFAVHQLRFVLAYGADARRVLHEAGHGYLPFAGAAAVALLLVAAVQFTGALLHCTVWRPRVEQSALRPRQLWLQNAILLVAAYVIQETLEGAFAPGHPVWSHGGWVIVPLAVVFGGLVALILAGSQRALVAAARRAAGPARVKRPLSPRARPRDATLVAQRPAARHLASRAPPYGRRAARPHAVAAPA